MTFLDIKNFASSRRADWRAQDIICDIEDLLSRHENVSLEELNPSDSLISEHYDVVLSGDLDALLLFKEKEGLGSDPYEF